jgi:phosphohistidine phosphatase
MNLLVMRHAIAEDRALYAQAHADDAGRPLTPDGVRKMRKVASGLRAVLPKVDLLASSPLTRAIQTAEIVAEAYGRPAPAVVPVLAPAQPLEAAAAWLERQRRHEVVAVVGHEPSLSRLVSWLLSGGERSFLEMKKGAACLLTFEDTVAAGAATLRWALTPSQLRRLRD